MPVHPTMVRAALGLTLLLTPAAVRAQDAQCDIDENAPRQVALAKLSFQKVVNAKAPPERQKAVKEMVRTLNEMKTAENPFGQALLLGQAAMMWLFDPGPETVARGDVGLPGDPKATVDLAQFADSAFTVVEKGKPSCRGLVGQWRTQQGWFRHIQGGFAAIGEGNDAKAEGEARRSLVLNRATPYAPYLLAAIAQKRMDTQTETRAASADSALKYYAAAVALAGKDTSVAEIRRRSMFEPVRILVDRFETAVITALKPACEKDAPPAAAAGTAYLTDYPTGQEAFGVRSNVASMFTTCGDTAKVEALYEPVLQAPATYGDIEATQAGVTMTRLNRSAKAGRLYLAALQLNPNQRDALNNLIATHNSDGKFQEMLPLVDRLVALDPNNPDNWLWYAYAYQGLAKGLKAADPKRKAFTDSLVKYNQVSETMPLKVTVSQFTRGETESRVGGSVEHRIVAPPAPPAPAKGAKGKAAPKPAAPPPQPAKDVTLRVVFLDKDGAGIDTVTAALGPVKPGETKEFTAVAKKPGVLAYKYLKID